MFCRSHRPPPPGDRRTRRGLNLMCMSAVYSLTLSIFVWEGGRAGWGPPLSIFIRIHVQPRTAFSSSIILGYFFVGFFWGGREEGSSFVARGIMLASFWVIAHCFSLVSKVRGRAFFLSSPDSCKAGTAVETKIHPNFPSVVRVSLR